MTDPTLIVHIMTNAPHQIQWFRSIAALPKPLNPGQITQIYGLLVAQHASLVGKESILRAHPPDPTQRATLIPIINELIYYLNAMQIAQPQLASHTAPVMTVLRQIEVVVAGGPASPAVRQVAQNLDRLSNIAIQEAIAVEAELKTMLSEEAQKIRVENAIMVHMQATVQFLKDALQELKLAEQNVNKNAHAAALTRLNNASTEITAINAAIGTALTTDTMEQEIANKIAKRLKIAHADLSQAAAEIKNNNGW